MDQDSLVDPLHMQYDDYMVQDAESRKFTFDFYDMQILTDVTFLINSR